MALKKCYEISYDYKISYDAQDRVYGIGTRKQEQKIFVIAKTKDEARKKFTRYVENYPWPREVERVDIIRVGPLWTALV